MAKTAVINIRTEPETKKAMKELFKESGISITEAFNIFINKAIQYGGKPFEVRIPRYNEETLAAFREVEEMKKNPHLYKSYSSFDELLEEVLSEIEDEDEDEV